MATFIINPIPGNPPDGKIYLSKFNLGPNAAYPTNIKTGNNGPGKVNLVVITGLGDEPNTVFVSIRFAGIQVRKLKQRYLRQQDELRIWFIAKDGSRAEEEEIADRVEPLRIIGIGDLVVTIETDGGPTTETAPSITIIDA